MTETSSTYLATGTAGCIRIWSSPSVTDIQDPMRHSDLVHSESTPGVFTGLAWHPRTFRLAYLHGIPANEMRVICFPSVPHRGLEANHINFHLSKTDSSANAVCLAFPQRSGRYAAIGFDNGNVEVLNFRKVLMFRDQMSHQLRLSEQPSCLTWAAFDKVLVIGTKTGSLYVSPIECYENKENRVLRLSDSSNSLDDSPCLALRASPSDTNIVAAAFANGLIILWSLDWPNSSGQVLLRLEVNVIPSFHESSSLAFSTTNPCMLASCGAPDLSLRLWPVGKYTVTRPIHVCAPVEPQSGYLSCDVNALGRILAAGLVDGRVILYDFCQFPVSLYEFRAHETLPVSFLSFAVTIGPHEEVQFQSILETTASPKLGTIPEEIESTPSRRPFGELTNTDPMYFEIEQNSVFHGISIPGLSDLSDSVSLRSSPQSILRSDVSQPCEYFLEASKSMHILPTVDPNSSAGNHQVASSDEPMSIPASFRGITYQTQLDDLKTLIQRSHSELSDRLSRLEHKMDDILQKFSTELLRVNQNYYALRLELDKRFYFY